MIVLYPNEQVLFRKEAKITIKVKLKPGKIVGKGIFYITNFRVVFEDYKQGILTQFALNEMYGYRKVKGLLGNEKLSIDYQRTNSNDVMLAEIEFKGVDEAYKILSSISNINIIVSNDVIITNYNMMNINKSNTQTDDTPDWLKPWIKDIEFKWNYKERLKELKFIFDENKTQHWGFFRLYVLEIKNNLKDLSKWFDITRFSDDFKYKVAREGYKIRAEFPIEKHFTYDSNRYWVGIIENAYKDGRPELVGVNINALSSSGLFIFNPIHWFLRLDGILSVGYSIERDKICELYEDERMKTYITTYGNLARNYYFAICNKDIKKAYELAKEMSDVIRNYESDSGWLIDVGSLGLVTRYANEMFKRNIPYPTRFAEIPKIIQVLSSINY